MGANLQHVNRLMHVILRLRHTVTLILFVLCLVNSRGTKAFLCSSSSVEYYRSIALNITEKLNSIIYYAYNK